MTLPKTSPQCDARREYLKSALPKSTSTAQQHCNFTTNCHQFSTEARVKENEDINNYGQP
jgi:hypothetical protein